MRLDWYEATIECDTVSLLALIITATGRDPDTKPILKVGKGRHGYKRSHTITSQYYELTILDLGNDGYPHIIGTGPSADIAHRFARALNVPGRVSRIDIAVDSLEGWEAAANRVYQWGAEHPNTVIIHHGDFMRGNKGRTLYVGAASSARRIRVYEKGVQLNTDPQWVRVELQYRPENRAAKAWTFDSLTQDIANSHRAFIALRATEGLYAPPAYQPPTRQPLLALARQYGNTLREEVPDAWRIIVDHLKYEWTPE